MLSVASPKRAVPPIFFLLLGAAFSAKKFGHLETIA